MKKYYLSSFNDTTSGIYHYSVDFYTHILVSEGFIWISSCKTQDDVELLFHQFNSNDVLFFEIGVRSDLERSLLFRALEAEKFEVYVTLHDPPHIKYPYYSIPTHLGSQASKFAQLHFTKLGFGRQLYHRINKIYTLSARGAEMVRRMYGANNVCSIPFILNTGGLQEPRESGSFPRLVYTGFIGKKKGLDYALRLHRELVKTGSEIEFSVTGRAIGRKNERYLSKLARVYKDKTHFLGYVETGKLTELISDDAILLLPTEDYRSVCPMSANVLRGLFNGAIVVTSRANANTEIIENDQNGYFLSFNMKKDLTLLRSLINNETRRRRIRRSASEYVMRNFSPRAVKERIDSCRKDNET